MVLSQANCLTILVRHFFQTTDPIHNFKDRSRKLLRQSRVQLRDQTGPRSVLGNLEFNLETISLKIVYVPGNRN